MAYKNFQKPNYCLNQIVVLQSHFSLTAGCDSIITHKHGDHYHTSTEICIHQIDICFNTSEKHGRPTSIVRKCAESTSVNRINPTNKHDGTKSPFTSTPEKNKWRVGGSKRDRKRKWSDYWSCRVKRERSLVTTQPADARARMVDCVVSI